MRIRIDGAEYPLSDIHSATLADLLLLEQQTTAVGHRMDLNDLKRLSREMQAIEDPDERLGHPDALWMLGATIWLCKRRAGESVDFITAVDFPMDKLEWISEPGDPKPNPRKAARPGSGLVADHRPKSKPRSPSKKPSAKGS